MSLVSTRKHTSSLAPCIPDQSHSRKPRARARRHHGLYYTKEKSDCRAGPRHLLQYPAPALI